MFHVWMLDENAIITTIRSPSDPVASWALETLLLPCTFSVQLIERTIYYSRYCANQLYDLGGVKP